jgi:nucleotide-binding universal stress UspA family protein
MTTPVILVPLDGTTETLGALPVARELARAERATVLAVHVTEEKLPAARFVRETGLEREELRGVVVEVRSGDPADAVLAVAREKEPRAIVLCAKTAERGTVGIRGSTAERVFRDAPCPVVVVRRTEDTSGWSLRTVLLPHDGTPTTSAAIGPAFELARKAGARLHVLHVTGLGAKPSCEPGSLGVPRYVDQRQHEWPAWAQEFLERLASACPSCPDISELRLSLARGDPSSEIVRFAGDQSIDLVVLAWQGGVEPDRALALRGVLRDAPCPVMVLRTEGRAAG